jgi:hypothetical protein
MIVVMINGIVNLTERLQGTGPKDPYTRTLTRPND